MIQMANDVFDTKSDPEQLDVDETVIARLKEIHPATVSEFADEHGPAIWILVIPTITALMQQFLNHEISEQKLAEQTPIGAQYDAIYLCSAMVLEEYRGKGMAKKLTVDAIATIMETNQVKALFVWPFSPEGEALAESIAWATSLPLFKRT